MISGGRFGSAKLESSHLKQTGHALKSKSYLLSTSSNSNNFSLGILLRRSNTLMNSR